MFTVDITDALAGRTLAQVDFTNRTGCSVVAVMDGTEVITANPGATTAMPPGGSLLLIGSSDAEEQARKLAEKVGRNPARA